VLNSEETNTVCYSYFLLYKLLFLLCLFVRPFLNIDCLFVVYAVENVACFCAYLTFIYIYIYIYIYIEYGRPEPWRSVGWPLDDIAITNIVWCMAYKGGVGGGGRILRYGCAIVLQ